MKVYVKKDKVLKLLGEGKVYSKKELILKEEESNPLISDVTPNDETIHGASGLQNAVNKQMANHPVSDGFSTELGNLSQGANQQRGNGVITMTQKQLGDGQNKQMLDKLAQTNPNMQVNIMKNNQSLEMNSVLSRKVMDEMRENSIPFTKSELTEFLKSL